MITRWVEKRDFDQTVSWLLRSYAVKTAFRDFAPYTILELAHIPDDARCTISIWLCHGHVMFYSVGGIVVESLPA